MAHMMSEALTDTEKLIIAYYFLHFVARNQKEDAGMHAVQAIDLVGLRELPCLYLAVHLQPRSISRSTLAS
jgi:hypothetical protein